MLKIGHASPFPAITNFKLLHQIKHKQGLTKKVVRVRGEGGETQGGRVNMVKIGFLLHPCPLMSIINRVFQKNCVFHQVTFVKGLEKFHVANTIQRKLSGATGFF